MQVTSVINPAVSCHYQGIYNLSKVLRKMNIKQKSLLKGFLNRNCRSVLFGVDQTEVAVLKISYFQCRILSANKIDVVIHFFKVISQSLLICL